MFIVGVAIQSCRREIQSLKEKELALQSELASASKEVLRLREIQKEYPTGGNNGNV
jgi:RAP1 GTPase activating protein 1